MKRMIVGIALMAGGCATASGSAISYRCEAEPVQDRIGRSATAELGADALARSHSRALRWIRPGDAGTMDLREDRLNISLDAQGNVDRISCG